jgi:NAD(P)-dependent dehydrogenase (short-subunit alcohol dehydrogenase family)
MDAARLAGRVAIVTGAGSGIGRAVAERLAAEGAAVIAAGRRVARLEDTVAAITAAGGRARAVACDVADVGQVQGVVEAATAFGGVDCLINNAVTSRPDAPLAERVAELDPRWWAATMDVSLTGAFLCARAAVAAMVAQGRGGSIVNIASTSGVAGNWNQSAYVAAKHGLVGLTRAIALDYAAHRIRANAVCPGFIETDRSLAFSRNNRGDDWEQRKLAEIPLGRFGQAVEVAALVAFLASEDAAYISGAVIPIDGGTAARRG